MIKIFIGETQKGYVLLAGGIILLMYSLNVFREWMNVFIILAAFFMIIYGLIRTGLYDQILALFKHKK